MVTRCCWCHCCRSHVQNRIGEVKSGWRRMSLLDINGWVDESFNTGSYYECNNWKTQICLIIGGEEGRCDIGVVHGGIPHAGLALQLELPMATTSIPSPKVWEECWNSGLDARLEAVTTIIHLEAVAAMSKSARLWETLPMTSSMLDPFENPVTWMFDSCMSKNLNFELKKEEDCTCDPLKREVEGPPGALGCRPFGGEAYKVHELR
jgi:hypothetical protein